MGGCEEEEEGSIIVDFESVWVREGGVGREDDVGDVAEEDWFEEEDKDEEKEEVEEEESDKEEEVEEDEDEVKIEDEESD